MAVGIIINTYREMSISIYTVSVMFGFGGGISFLYRAQDPQWSIDIDI